MTNKTVINTVITQYMSGQEFSTINNHIKEKLDAILIEDHLLLKRLKPNNTDKYEAALCEEYKTAFTDAINETDDIIESYGLNSNIITHIRLMFSQTINLALGDIFRTCLLIPNDENVLRAVSAAGELKSIPSEMSISQTVHTPADQEQDLEIMEDVEHQSNPILPHLETTNNSVNVRKKNKNKKGTNQNTQPDKNNKSGKRPIESSGTQQPSKSADNKKVKFQPKFSSAIITGYSPSETEARNVKEVIIYDVPASWDDEKLVHAFNAWGKLISIFKKRQRKYQTLRVKIAMSDFCFQLYNQGVWSLFLDDILVRWYPIEWQLKERKERERFQVTIKDLPEDLTMDKLIVDHQPTEFLNSLGLKYFKIVTNVKKQRKLIGYVETWQALQMRICSPTIWNEVTLDWQRHQSPSSYYKSNKNKTSNQDSSFKRNMNPKKQEKSTKPAERNEKNKKNNRQGGNFDKKKKSLQKLVGKLLELLE